MSAFRLAIAAIVLVADATAQGHVWTVGGAGADFADLPPAVAAAADGDTLLVRPGPYSGFAAFDKALSIAADPAGSAHIAGEVRVEDLAAGKTFVLSGFVVTSANAYGSNALRLRNNPGAIRIQGSSFSGHDGVVYIDPGKQAGFVANSADVAFTSCTFRGGSGFDGYGPGSGGPGLFARASQVALYDCTLRGGDGGSDTAEEGYDGGWAGHGFESPNGLVFASGCLFQGGAGGYGGEEDGYPPDFGNYAGNGGGRRRRAAPGQHPAFRRRPEARLLDCTEIGGPGGAGGAGFWRGNGSPGPAGMAIRIFNGVLTPVAGSARVLVSAIPAREYTNLPLLCTASPGIACGS
jgi:hypothetical protein